MQTDTELPLADARLAVAPSEPIARILEAALDKGVTESNIAVMERLMALYERVQEKNAEKLFAEAFVALQADTPRITATRPVPDKHGNLKYCFAPYEDIMAEVKPLLQKHGFTLTFSMDFKEGRVIQSCTLQHIGGHKRTNTFAARVGSGPPGASEAQADGSAATYSKRFALCDSLGIVIERDDDARSVGDGKLISDDQAIYLREQVKEKGADEARFLKLACAESFEKIAADKYDLLLAALGQKRKS